MIQTYSSTIRRKEMEAVLTCMVDEKLGPGEMNAKLLQTAKELIGYDGGVALRSPNLALEYALKAIDLPKDSLIMLSALAPAWQLITVERLGYKAIILDVIEETGLITPKAVEDGIAEGGRLLILTESMGILPAIKEFLAFNIPVIEDVSQSVLAHYPFDEEMAVKKVSAPKEGETAEEPKGPAAGMYGLYSILSMEDRDIVTAGGGALLFAPKRREWSVLKSLVEQAPSTDIMPDMNAALAYVEFKEFGRNEKARKDLFKAYSQAIASSRHHTYARPGDDASTIYSFPVVLGSGFKDVKSYANKKGLEIRQAYENSIIAYRQEELSKKCICANSLLLRCAMFPLYPRLGQVDVNKILKVLSTML